MTNITIGKIYHLLDKDDRWVILCVLNYFNMTEKYNQIVNSFAHNKLPFIDLLHALSCLKQGLTILHENPNLQISPSKDYETIILKVYDGFNNNENRIIGDPVQEVKEIDVTDTWEDFKTKEQRVIKLILLIEKHLL